MLINLDKEIFNEYIQWNNLSLEQGATLEDYRMALDKQKAKKPNDKEFIDGTISKFWRGRCPCCDEMIGDGYEFCGRCGQKIDWSEEGEQNEKG